LISYILTSPKLLTDIKLDKNRRKQCVRVDDEYSSWEIVKSGILQESVLGSIIFVIFINDMPDVVVSMCQLFTDDAKIFRGLKSINDIFALQKYLERLDDWSKKW